ncbi:PDP1 [Cordylochernes scorpioides]|uniref:PDP1 n=1 Tax=Cordylochernes scorpioides TaxID=51811 RepID=A0ABY6LL19_9ARAC|nr:PDP1 [Cordylochernes scorpioides]UYV80406.1 PDP1 [Cordylochernes scorpioides]
MSFAKVSAYTFQNFNTKYNLFYICTKQLRINKRFNHHYGSPKLSPKEVSSVLRTNENYRHVNYGSIKSYETNQLPSNNPIEDRIAIGQCHHTTGTIFGIFDGHGGTNCVDVISSRLLEYMALSLLPKKLLKDILENSEDKITSLIDYLYETDLLTSMQKEAHHKSLRQYALKLLNSDSYKEDFFMNHALSESFLRMDNDLSREVREQVVYDQRAIMGAVSGACSCVAHIDGSHVHIATLGDCKVVLGALNDENKWVCKSLTQEHNSDNLEEYKRVLSEHPQSEANKVIRNDRLLGQLAPFRAFGDFMYKWDMDTQHKYLVPHFGYVVSPSQYLTPPYLTASPEIIHYRLTPRDKFLVLATDGLWDEMLPHKVVKFVGEHMNGNQTLDLLRLPKRNMSLKDIDHILHTRQVGLTTKPLDKNAATHLIRNALGRTEYGIEHSRLSTMLTLPDEIVRNFRDDISIIVIYLDSDFLRDAPPDN